MSVNLQDKNRVKVVGALQLSAQATCPYPLGQSGFWMDNNGVRYFRETDGTDTAGDPSVTYGAAGDMATAGLAAANAAGVSAKVARTDHVHATGPQVAAAAALAVADPGASGAIAVTKGGVCRLVTAGAETRTLAIPTFLGQELTLQMKTDGGDCVVTSAQAVNQTGNNTLTFNDAGDMIKLIAIDVGGALRWRVVANDGVGLSTV